MLEKEWKENPPEYDQEVIAKVEIEMKGGRECQEHD